MKPKHLAEAALLEAALACAGALSSRGALRLGAALGSLVGGLGIRRRVARENLAIAFPELTERQRDAILAAHYREVGRIAIEYARLPQLVRAPEHEVFTEIEGREHLEALRGRGAVLLAGHFGNFELLGATLARWQPVDFIVKPLSNPAVEARIERLRREAGIGLIPLGTSVRQVYKALRAGRWVAMLADQNARRDGVFVPFFGKLASTPEGPARLALQMGVPIMFGWGHRVADGRHRLVLDPPYTPTGGADEENIRALTAWHTARLEAVIRTAPEHWFWLHRRWKTRPPAERSGAAPAHA